MKRFLIGWVIVITGLFVPTPVYASVNDFIIKDFHAGYYLSRDSENRSTLKTVEDITIVFPDYDQNHGIERAIPKTYDNHQVNLSIQSVTDETKKAVNYRLIDDNNGNQVVRIGDADKYVHGEKNYIITYTQRDVVKYFSDINDDEFYWDINGSSWSQNFEKVSATIHIEKNLVDSLSGKLACYYGTSGSTDKCDIYQTGETITANITNLGPYQTMTVAIGFQPKTFTEYQKTDSEKFADFCAEIYVLLTILAAAASTILMIYVIFIRIKYGRGAKSGHAIVAEYVPPQGVDIITSAVMLKNSQNWVAALYIDLAIKGVIRVIESKKGIFKRLSYSIELMSTSDINDDERDILVSLFGADLAIGSVHEFKNNKPDYSVYSKLKSVKKRVEARALADGYYEENKYANKKITRSIIALSIMLIFMGVSIFALIVAGIIAANMKPLSQKGRDLVDYLEGLKLYIKTAEEDRIKYLQSPKGAEKITIDTNDQSAMVKLYEKLLPYAVIFGCEKEWSKVLGKYYEAQSKNPDWYHGNDVFNAVMFSSAISSFSSMAISNSYSSPSSSSSGGSGGGGFAGGGGGGGGGGGW